MSPGFSGTFLMPLPAKALPRKYFNEPLPFLTTDYFLTPLLF